jgi:hypothetical protein
MAFAHSSGLKKKKVHTHLSLSLPGKMLATVCHAHGRNTSIPQVHPHAFTSICHDPQPNQASRQRHVRNNNARRRGGETGSEQGLKKWMFFSLFCDGERGIAFSSRCTTDLGRKSEAICLSGRKSGHSEMTRKASSSVSPTSPSILDHVKSVFSLSTTTLQ